MVDSFSFDSVSLCSMAFGAVGEGSNSVRILIFWLSQNNPAMFNCQVSVVCALITASRSRHSRKYIHVYVMCMCSTYFSSSLHPFQIASFAELPICCCCCSQKQIDFECAISLARDSEEIELPPGRECVLLSVLENCMTKILRVGTTLGD